MKLGARIIKTGLAITLSIYLATLLHFQTPVYAAIAATFAIQPSIYRSYQTVLEQAQGNIVGAIVAIILVLVLGNNPFVVGFAVVLVIVANLRLKIENTIPLAIVTAIVIMESHAGNFVGFAVKRFLLIMLGVVAASLVNLIFAPPKYETKLFYKMSSNTDQIIKWIRMVTRHACEHSTLKEDLAQIKVNRIKTDQFYLLYKEDRTYFRKSIFSKSRKLVLYRQMIQTNSKAFELLKSLHRHENELLQMPDELQELIRVQLDCLTNYHEQMLLKYTNKIRTQYTVGMVDEICENKNSLLKSFMSYSEIKDNEQWMHLFPVIALVMDYSDQLEHLNILIESFKNHHADDTAIQLQEEEQ